MKNLLLILLLMTVSACIPEDIPVQPHIPGDVTQVTLEIGANYEHQIFYQLSTEKQISKNLYTEWDFAFHCEANSKSILLNSSKYMNVYKTGKTNFDSIATKIIFEIPDTAWVFDNPRGEYDSTAIGQWWDLEGNVLISKNEVYIINLGADLSGKSLGYKKVQVLSMDNEIFTIKYADLNGKNLQTAVVSKDFTKNWIMYSFANNKVVAIEPNSDEWDLQFTRYTDELPVGDGTYLWYSVTSVIINPKYTSVAVDTITKFENINAMNVDKYVFSNRVNIIGHDWKWFDLNNTGTYFVLSNKNYIIKDRENRYYKLHFLDYYNSKGEKGYPKFEFQRL